MINKKMTLLDIVDKYPFTQDVFHSYDDRAGVCILCENLFSTIEELALYYELDMEEIISRLEKEIAKDH